jgi:hypothetical protein
LKIWHGQGKSETIKLVHFGFRITPACAGTPAVFFLFFRNDWLELASIRFALVYEYGR